MTWGEGCAEAGFGLVKLAVGKAAFLSGEVAE